MKGSNDIYLFPASRREIQTIYFEWPFTLSAAKGYKHIHSHVRVRTITVSDSGFINMLKFTFFKKEVRKKS